MDYIVASSHAALELTEIKTALLDGGHMLLFKNDFTPNNLSALIDFTEADFTGYTPGGVTLTLWSDYYDVPGGGRATLSPTANWNAASPFTITNTIYGVYVLDANGDLIGGCRFDTPAAMGGAGDAIHFAIEHVFSQPS